MLNNFSVLPVAVISLGKFSKTEQVGKDKNNKPIFADKEKHRFAVFFRQAKDTVFLIDSEGDNDPVVPPFKDAVKLPNISLKDSSEWKASINSSMVIALTQFLANPLEKMGGITPYKLFTDGFISEYLFKTIVLNYLKVGAMASGVNISNINLAEILPLIAKGSLVNSNAYSDITLDDHIKRYLTSIENKQKMIQQTLIRENVTTVDTVAEPVSVPVNFYDGVDFYKLTKSDLVKACKFHKIPYSKKTVKQMADLLTDHLTTPDPTTV